MPRLLINLVRGRSPFVLELMLCSMLTLVPDFLFRRFVQGKRLGREISGGAEF